MNRDKIWNVVKWFGIVFAIFIGISTFLLPIYLETYQIVIIVLTVIAIMLIILGILLLKNYCDKWQGYLFALVLGLGIGFAIIACLGFLNYSELISIEAFQSLLPLQKIILIIICSTFSIPLLLGLIKLLLWLIKKIKVLIKACISFINREKTDLNTKIQELKTQIEAKDKSIEELNKSISQLTKEKCKDSECQKYKIVSDLLKYKEGKKDE